MTRVRCSRFSKISPHRFHPLSHIVHAFKNTRHQVGGTGAVLSTVARAKESVRTIRRLGRGFVARTEDGGVTDFSVHSDIGSTRSHGTPGYGIEMSRGILKRRSFVHGSSSTPGIDQSGSGKARISGNILSVKKASLAGRAAPVRPHSPTKQSRLAAVTLAPRSGTPPSTTEPGQTTLEAVCDADGTGDNGTTSHHHANSSGMPGQHWPSELDAQREYKCQMATVDAFADNTENMWQAQLRPQRTNGRPEPAVEVVGSGSSRAQPQSPDEHRAEHGVGDNTAATKIGNILMGLPLSKLKIVIGKLSHSIYRNHLERYGTC